MPLHHIFIDGQSTFLSRLASIPNDGDDYEIVFASGTYTLNNRFITSYLTLDHSAGGKLILRPHTGTAAVNFIGDLNGGYFNILGVDISLHGLHFGDHIPYFVPTNFFPCKMVIGGYKLVTSSAVCDPATITITNCSSNGSSNLVIHCSDNPAIYTNIRILNHRISEGGVNGIIALAASGAPGAYCHATIDNLTGNGKCGPDTTVWDPASLIIPPNLGSHGNGTAAISHSTLTGSSSLLVTRGNYTSQILGSANHDMHCLQYNQLLSSDVTVTHRDCIFRGRWEAGHAQGDGGGNMWIGYYHGSGPIYPIARPQFVFENCTLESTILDAVTQPPADMAGGFLPIWNAGSDADYHFWDSSLAWIVPARFLPYTYGIVASTDNVNVFLHKSTISATTPETVSANPSRSFTTNALSLLNPGPIHGRVPVLF